MAREAKPRVVGCWSGVQGLAAVERQAPAEDELIEALRPSAAVARLGDGQFRRLHQNADFDRWSSRSRADALMQTREQLSPADDAGDKAPA
jgi:hypothetical protein